MTTSNARLGYLLVVSASTGLCIAEGFSAAQPTDLLVGAALGIVGGAFLQATYQVVRYTVRLIAGCITAFILGVYSMRVDLDSLSKQELDEQAATFRFVYSLACVAVVVVAAFATYHYGLVPLYAFLKTPYAVRS